MKKVWIVRFCHYDDYTLHGIFDNEVTAIKVCKMLRRQYWQQDKNLNCYKKSNEYNVRDMFAAQIQAFEVLPYNVNAIYETP